MKNLKVLIFLLSVSTLFYAPVILNMDDDNKTKSKYNIDPDLPNEEITEELILESKKEELFLDYDSDGNGENQKQPEEVGEQIKELIKKMVRKAVKKIKVEEEETEQLTLDEKMKKEEKKGKKLIEKSEKKGEKLKKEVAILRKSAAKLKETGKEALATLLIKQATKMEKAGEKLKKTVKELKKAVAKLKKENEKKEKLKVDQSNKLRFMRFLSKLSLPFKLTLIVLAWKSSIVESMFKKIPFSKKLIPALNRFLGNDKTSLRWTVALISGLSVFLNNISPYLLKNFCENEKFEKRYKNLHLVHKILLQNTACFLGLIYPINIIFKSGKLSIIGKYLKGENVRLGVNAGLLACFIGKNIYR